MRAAPLSHDATLALATNIKLLLHSASHHKTPTTNHVYSSSQIPRHCQQQTPVRSCFPCSRSHTTYRFTAAHSSTTVPGKCKHEVLECTTSSVLTLIQRHGRQHPDHCRRHTRPGSAKFSFHETANRAALENLRVRLRRCCQRDRVRCSQQEDEVPKGRNDVASILQEGPSSLRRRAQLLTRQPRTAPRKSRRSLSSHKSFQRHLLL